MNTSVESLEFAFFAPAGFYIALRIGFAFPSEEHNAMPSRWVDRYTARGYMLYDPVIKWIYENTGATRWSETGLDDPRGVMAEAREHGLNFGVAICCADKSEEGQRSFGSFARSDREFDAAEIRILTAQADCRRIGRLRWRCQTASEKCPAEAECQDWNSGGIHGHCLWFDLTA
jgi:LuxR family transcriptional regulator, quorum-sensing system regulator SdiA